ncbi:hypothetical protein BDF14DRAFT_356366 [Spinellus fusiger]|nr:hypothetical protein BDF14DRAFT_356366 [Spinellus fusiger]
MSSTQLLKRSLRKELKHKLRALPSSLVQSQSCAVMNHLHALDCYQKSRSISVYISMPHGEIDTRHILQSILHTGEKTLYVPMCTKDTMEMVKIATWREFLDLPVNAWGIPEPLPTAENVKVMETAMETSGLDLILVPGVAFDTAHQRIGHGKGYYDRYIEKCQQWASTSRCSPPTTVALALNEQILQPGILPIESTDKQLDYILTPQGIL